MKPPFLGLLEMGVSVERVATMLHISQETVERIQQQAQNEDETKTFDEKLSGINQTLSQIARIIL